VDRDWRLRNIASDIEKKEKIEIMLVMLREKERENRNNTSDVRKVKRF
jgi:hypothetical protein